MSDAVLSTIHKLSYFLRKIKSWRSFRLTFISTKSMTPSPFVFLLASTDLSYLNKTNFSAKKALSIIESLMVALIVGPEVREIIFISVTGLVFLFK